MRSVKGCSRTAGGQLDSPLRRDQNDVMRPTLSLVVPTRHGWPAVEPLVTAMLPELRDVEGELVVVGLGNGPDPKPPAGVRAIPVSDDDMLRLRLRAVREARGSIVAIGEDHSLPARGWWKAVLRAHAEHPTSPAIVGCLVNDANQSASGRANFIAFAGPYIPPMPAVPNWRPPPLSTLSLKREALSALDDRPGSLDGLANRLFEEGQMVADDGIVIHHDQDLGVAGSIRNAYTVTRAAYGYSVDRLEPGRRREVVRWVVTHLPQMVWRMGRARQPPTPRRQAELAIVAAMATANAAGAVVGSIAGHGKAPERYE
jgi:hypothetical protein